MANILEKYGIKEVADVMFYEIAANGKPGAPALYLDTLKVSTIEVLTVRKAEPLGFIGVITMPSSVRSTPSRSGSSTNRLSSR